MSDDLGGSAHLGSQGGKGPLHPFSSFSSFYFALKTCHLGFSDMLNTNMGFRESISAEEPSNPAPHTLVLADPACTARLHRLGVHTIVSGLRLCRRSISRGCCARRPGPRGTWRAYSQPCRPSTNTCWSSPPRARSTTGSLCRRIQVRQLLYALKVWYLRRTHEIIGVAARRENAKGRPSRRDATAATPRPRAAAGHARGDACSRRELGRGQGLDRQFQWQELQQKKMEASR